MLAIIAATALITLPACGEAGNTAEKSGGSGSVSSTASSSSTDSDGTTATAPDAAPDPTGQPENTIWPFASETSRYDDPVMAAASFALHYLGFEQTTNSAFRPATDSSGEVDIQANGASLITTIQLVKAGSDDSWWVTGATSDSIRIQTPSPGDEVASPVAVSGESTAFEGTVNVEIHESGRREALAEGIAMGGANGEMGSFSTQLDMTEGGAATGAVVVKEISMADGEGTLVAAVVRVRFG